MTQLAIGILVEKETLPLLPQTIASVKTLSPRIYVLVVGDDCDVQDDSVTVFHGGWTDDEAATRNTLIDFIENAHVQSTDSDIEGEITVNHADVAEYLLWIHPGEEFDARTLDEFNDFIEHDIHRESLYMMVIHRLFREDRLRHDFDEESIEARLMPLRKGIRYKGKVRATILTQSTHLMIPISAAPGRFLLHAKKNDPAKSKRCAERNLQTLEKMEQAGEAIQDDLLAVRAEAQFILGYCADARRTLKELIASTQRSDLRLSAYFSLWETFSVSSIPDAEVTKILIESLDHFPVEMQLLTFLGSHLQRTGQIELAVRTFETAVRHGRVSLDVWHRLHIREIAVISWALSLRLMNRNADAVKVLESNIELVEDRSEYNKYLLDLYITENCEDKCAELAAAIWGDADLDLIRLTLKGACLAKAGRWDQALIPLKQSYEQGCRDMVCLRWYAMALLARRQFTEAVEILGQWLALQPENTEAKSYLAAAKRPDRFNETLHRINQAHLRALGIVTEGATPRKPNIRIEDAVKEMIQTSGTCGKIIGFKPKTQKKSF